MAIKKNTKAKKEKPQNVCVRRLDYEAARKILFPVPAFLCKGIAPVVKWGSKIEVGKLKPMPVPTNWRPWAEPKNSLAIDESIKTLKNRDASPSLRTRFELEQDPLNVLCPYYFVRAMIALAVRNAHEACEIKKYSRDRKTDDLEKNIKATRKMHEQITTFLKRCSVGPKLFPEKITDQHLELDSEANTANDQSFRTNLIEHLYERIAEGGDLNLTDMPHTAHFIAHKYPSQPNNGNLIFETLELTFASLQSSVLRLDYIIKTLKSQKAYISPANADGDVWKGAFVLTLCYAWHVLTGVDPNLGECCIKFMSDAYASLGGIDDSWERQIKAAIGQNMTMPADGRFDRYERRVL